MHYRCSRCDDELTYAVCSGDFEEGGLLCDHCQGRYDKFDHYRVWRENKARREGYIDKWIREFIDKKLDELLDE